MEYNKPKSMSHKEYLVRALSIKLAISEKTVEAVVNHQFQSANEAMDTNHSLELSGLKLLGWVGVLSYSPLTGRFGFISG